MESFDPKEGTWELQPCMRVPRYCMCSESTRGRLYVCGGCTLPTYQPPSTVYCLNLMNNGNPPGLPHCMVKSGLRARHEQQFMVEPTQSAEYFDFCQERWVQLMPMTYGPRYNAATVCVGGHIYVMGGVFVPEIKVDGDDGDEDLDSPPSSIGSVRSFVERLTPSGWQRLPRMQKARAGASAVTDPVQARLIVCGGHDGTLDFPNH